MGKVTCDIDSSVEGAKRSRAVVLEERVMLHGTRSNGVALVLAVAMYSATASGQGASLDQQIQAGQQAAAQGQQAEAERLVTQALQQSEKLGKEDERRGAVLTGLGLAFSAQRKFAEAEPILQRAVVVKEKVLGPDSPDFARALLDLGALYRLKDEHAKSEPPIRRAVAILERALGPEHPEVAGNLTNLGGRLRDQGKFTEAEPILKRALAIRLKILSPDSPDIVRSTLGLANLYADQKKYADADPLFQKAVATLERIKSYGTGYPNLPDTLRLYAGILKNSGRAVDAEKMEARANTLRPQ
jgi:tetratricopeptide (TPR) repeat protein